MAMTAQRRLIDFVRTILRVAIRMGDEFLHQSVDFIGKGRESHCQRVTQMPKSSVAFVKIVQQQFGTRKFRHHRPQEAMHGVGVVLLQYHQAAGGQLGRIRLPGREQPIQSLPNSRLMRFPGAKQQAGFRRRKRAAKSIVIIRGSALDDVG